MQVRVTEFNKFIQEKGNLFGLDLGDEKNKEQEAINELKETVTDIKNEIKKLFKQIETQGNTMDQKLHEKIGNQDIPKIQETIMVEVNKSLQKMLKKVAEKEELKIAMKYFEKLITNLHAYIKNKFTLTEDTDDAMLTKKPLLQAKCASCERNLKNLSGIINANGHEFTQWNKMPQREPIAKYGKGFSKILASIKTGEPIMDELFDSSN